MHLKIANLNKFLSNCLHKNLEKHFLMALITTKFSKSQKRDAAKQAKYLHSRAVGRSEYPGGGGPSNNVVGIICPLIEMGFPIKFFPSYIISDRGRRKV